MTTTMFDPKPDEARDLHDLVQKVLAVSHDHPAHNAARDALWTFADAVTMKARLIEMRQRLDQMQSQEEVQS